MQAPPTTIQLGGTGVGAGGVGVSGTMHFLQSAFAASDAEDSRVAELLMKQLQEEKVNDERERQAAAAQEEALKKSLGETLGETPEETLGAGWTVNGETQTNGQQHHAHHQQQQRQQQQLAMRLASRRVANVARRRRYEALARRAQMIFSRLWEAVSVSMHFGFSVFLFHTAARPDTVANFCSSVIGRCMIVIMVNAITNGIDYFFSTVSQYTIVRRFLPATIISFLDRLNSRQPNDARDTRGKIVVMCRIMRMINMFIKFVVICILTNKIGTGFPVTNDCQVSPPLFSASVNDGGGGGDYADEDAVHNADAVHVDAMHNDTNIACIYSIFMLWSYWLYFIYISMCGFHGGVGAILRTHTQQNEQLEQRRAASQVTARFFTGYMISFVNSLPKVRLEPGESVECCICLETRKYDDADADADTEAGDGGTRESASAVERNCDRGCVGDDDNGGGAAVQVTQEEDAGSTNVVVNATRVLSDWMRLPCGHPEHFACQQWVVEHNSCPFCRRHLVRPTEICKAFETSRQELLSVCLRGEGGSRERGTTGDGQQIVTAIRPDTTAATRNDNSENDDDDVVVVVVVGDDAV